MTVDPLEKAVSTERTGLEDLKSLLEDRGGDSNVTEVTGFKRNGFKCARHSVFVMNTGRCFRLKTMLFLLVMVLCDTRLGVAARSPGKDNACILTPGGK
ncbi:hypothetical protein O3G_MSEX006658 [Manduca sexta]|uniref:Uncharacterized protein n=1 Tax=Manduca sexta TaxID=7130 RepID=A0A922CLN0_MANSE|nr:hypothetical protein O3G_MSEX006658 [Manduca sexta]